MYKIYYKEKNRNAHKFTLKDIPKNNNLQKPLYLNGFNIIELNEEEINKETEPDINIFSEREIQRLKKKAAEIEEYYSTKSEDTIISDNCFNCLMNNFKPNELLYFKKRKDLLTYLKYCFYFLKNILFLDNKIYIENIYDLDKCDINFLSGWKFFIPKAVCKACFLKIINLEHLFGNLKTIFSDVDPNSTSRSIHRNRTHFYSRSRQLHSVRRNNLSKNNNIKENDSEGKNKVILPEKENNKIKIKNPKYNSKNNHNISYNGKNGLISIKKNILGGVENLVKKEENEKDSKNHDKKMVFEYNEEMNNQNDEQSVREIKIRANEFIGEGNLSDCEETKEKNNNLIEIKKNKNYELSEKDENKLNKHYSNNNEGSIPNNINDNSININLINNLKNNKNIQENELKEDKSNNYLNKNKKNMNLYNEILNIKYMSNKTVIKLNFKLNAFKDILLYTIVNIGDFKEKLYNSMHFNPDIISYGINQYEQYFTALYHEGFKAKTEYEEMFTKIKKESIPSISKNLAKLKEVEKLDDDDKKNMDEMEKNLKEFSEKIDEMEKRYEESINNFFTNFSCFFNLIKELKASFGGQIY